MDIQKIIADLTEKLGGKADLLKNFLADPAKSIKELLNIDIDADKIGEIVEGVKAKLGDGLGDAAKEGKGILSKIMGFFKKK